VSNLDSDEVAAEARWPSQTVWQRAAQEEKQLSSLLQKQLLPGE